MNKAAIRSQFKALLNRNDCTNALADTFIDQAISRIQRTLRIPSMERAAMVNFDELMPDSFILPADFLEFIDLYCDGPHGGIKLEHVPLSKFIRTPKNVGTPRMYVRTGGTIQIKPSPAPGQTLSMVYYGEFSDLTADTDSNELTETAPELIIYAALSYASDYFVDERKDAFEAVFSRTYQELEEQARSLEFSGSDMAVQSAYPNSEY